MEKEIQKLEKEKQILSQFKEKIESMLNTAPEGGLVIRTKRGKPQYYWSRAGKAESYIKYNQIDFVKKLAQKSYFVNLQKHIANQLQAIQSFLESYSQISIDDIYEQLPDKRKELVDPIVLTDEQYRKQWQESHYTGKGFAVNDDEIITEKGERVRSKSEKMIADKLYMMDIPYKYEYPISLSSYGIVYPDFVVLNTIERKEVIIEHFGMMDNPEYSKNAVQKIEMYIKNGYIPGKNLILTFETSKKSLNIQMLEIQLKEILKN